MSLYAECYRAGGMLAHVGEEDPKRLAFVYARYKFVAKMLAGMGRVLEVGCADGYASRIVRQHVAHLTAADVDSRFIAMARERQSAWPIEYLEHDILAAPLVGFDAVYCLDVFEHITNEERLLANLRASAPVAIVGSPSLESQVYASALSRAGHVNCKSGADFRAALGGHWRNVFLFSMNDEVVHTGFAPMAHYLIALCVDAT